jgi:hypothetical protein
LLDELANRALRKIKIAEDVVASLGRKVSQKLKQALPRPTDRIGRDDD